MRFAIATLGCKVNQYDSATIEARLLARGMERREFDETADVYIVNTCTVTNRADAESLRLARRAKRLNPAARVVMTGCLAQASPARLANASEVDAIVGLGRPEDLERAIALGADERVMVSNLRKERAEIDLEAATLAGHTRAFLKLQEGCDQFCTFCIVPFSRGMSRSIEPRRVIDALDEVHRRGFKEVTLSGVHLGGYGKDLSPSVELADLLEMIAERSEIGRIRISSLDPEELSDRIIKILASGPCFCAHLHLPLQSGDDATLSRMRRRYDREYFRERVERVLEAMPSAAIGTDLIVGFPGESAEQFELYYEFVASLPLAYFHVFPYSVRDGTTAAKMPGKVRPLEIKRRAAQMRQLGELKRAEFARRAVGSRIQLLIEERARDGSLCGYSRNYIRVAVDGPDEIINQEVEVEVLSADAAQVAGQVVWPAAPSRAAAISS
jgi:threonylcarbamoyladenosine tRNA methylthiotransferase MtaB